MSLPRALFTCITLKILVFIKQFYIAIIESSNNDSLVTVKIKGGSWVLFLCDLASNILIQITLIRLISD